MPGIRPLVTRCRGPSSTAKRQTGLFWTLTSLDACPGKIDTEFAHNAVIYMTHRRVRARAADARARLAICMA